MMPDKTVILKPCSDLSDKWAKIYNLPRPGVWTLVDLKLRESVIPPTRYGIMKSNFFK